ncbi:hypothetical protein PFISCL1PPCAC_18292 [Pristionchus fissidentatus]|uniref:Nicastrin n=1 Tax=Pristionchus fissidentatus TaxID=1538716 RepID=A0AAV5W8N5_9BILA|nr:hypothetical protein PFISCL1PPCAC_18292 [Pristionchus fissidentatus]
MVSTSCILLIAATAAMIAADGDIKEQVVVQLPMGGRGFCIRLLNATHQFGCTSSMNGDEGVIVVARTKEDVEKASSGWNERFADYTGGFVVLMPELLLDGHTAPLLISSPRVSGVLLIPAKESEKIDPSTPLSAESACPNRKSSLYSDWRACGSTQNAAATAGGQWNGKGAMMEDGMRFTDWSKPMIRVINESVVETMIKCHDQFNVVSNENYSVEKEKETGRLCAVSMKVFMQASGSSTQCVRRQMGGNVMAQLEMPSSLCDPLEDHNLFGILPPGVQGKTGDGAYLAILTRMDGLATIPDASPATFGTMTSLVASLTAAKVIGDNLEMFERASNKSNRRLIFGFLHGESFDYVGSSRWVYDMEKGDFPPKKKSVDTSNDEVPELITMEKISLAIELQQIDASSQLHAHVDGKNYAADEKGKIARSVESMETAMKTLNFTLDTKKMNANGVLPPSSLHSILKKRRQTPSVLVTSFDEQYSNRRFHSSFDRLNGVDKKEGAKLKEAIKAVAQGVVAAAADHVGIKEKTKLDRLKVDGKWVDTLFDCLLSTTKLPDCDYFKKIFSQSAEAQDRSTFISAERQSILRKIVKTLLVTATGEKNSTLNVQDAETCKHLNEKQALYEYVWQLDPSNNTTYCYKTSIRTSHALSPAFMILDGRGSLDIAGSNYSTWTEAKFAISHEYSMFLVESRPADWTLLIVGLLTVLISILIVGRCDDSSFIVDEGERAAEEGEPL